MIFQYFTALLRGRFYVALLFISIGIGIKTPRFGLDSAPYVLILILALIWVSVPIVNPKDVLRINDFLMNLPVVREKLALMMVTAMLPLLTPFLLKAENLIVVSLTLMSLLISAFLVFNSIFAILTLPLAFVFVPIQCQSLKLASLVALAGPYPLWAIRTFGNRFSFRVSIHGFLIDGRYTVMLSFLVFVFDVLYRGNMEFVVGEYLGFRNPDFHPLLFILFTILSLALLSIPYFATYGLREGELSTAHLRAIIGTPVSRRALAFVIAFTLELPVLVYINLLEHFVIPPENALKLAGMGAFFNSVVPTGSNSKWTSYSFIGYILAVHLLLKAPAWQVIGLFFVLDIILYDIDVWRYGK